MSIRTTFADTPSAISLQGSEFGPSLFDELVGTIPGLPGQGHAHANLSPRQAKERGLLTSGTFGPSGSTSSSSADLQSSLESNLRKRLNGSILCDVTWRAWDTPWGQRLSKPRARVRSTYATAFGLWPTPAARDFRSESATPEFYSRWLAHPKGKTLPMLLALACHGSTDPMANGAPLSPEFPRWLMRIPAGWSSCAPTETPSTSRSQRSSSRPSSTPNETGWLDELI